MWTLVGLAAGIAVGGSYTLWQYIRISRGTGVWDAFLVRDRDGSMWGGRAALEIWGGPGGLAKALGLFWAVLVATWTLFFFSLAGLL